MHFFFLRYKSKKVYFILLREEGERERGGKKERERDRERMRMRWHDIPKKENGVKCAFLGAIMMYNHFENVRQIRNSLFTKKWETFT